MTDLVGKTLGDYRLDEVIGEGGMAVVYKAFQLSLKRWVAVKVLYYLEDTALERFRREAKAIAALRHRNILIIYAYGEGDGSPFIAMEYVEGGTLEDILADGPMDWRQAVELIIPVAEALHYAHRHAIIHRDVKPSNILMPQEGWPVLADFGLVKRSDEEQGLTRTGTFLGTPSYIAPEQARDAKMDHRVDMYALGVVLFEMVTGKLPFDYENPNKVLLAHVMDPPPRPQALNPKCPAQLEAIILKTLEKAAKDRYADMQELVQALHHVLNLPVSETVEVAGPVAPQSQAEPEQPSGMGRFFKKMFGRKAAKEAQQESDAAKTTPRQHLKVSTDKDTNNGVDDEFEGTVQLDLGKPAAQPIPRLIVKDKNATILFPEKDNLVIGRTFGNSVADIDLEPHDASKFGVSRQHARLLRQGDRWLLEDMNSLNGTFINDVQIKHGHPVVLNSGDRVKLSHMNFIFMES